jgi:hypothetical protein
MKSLPLGLTVLGVFIIGCSGGTSTTTDGTGGLVATSGTPSSGGAVTANTGGATATTASKVGASVGGNGVGGATSAAGGTNAQPTGGKSATGSTATGGKATGGNSSTGGANTGGTNTGTASAIGTKSAGCGKAPGIPSSKYNKGTSIDITAAGMQRRYVLQVPTNYDNTHPYKLVVTLHARDGNDKQMYNWQYYGLLAPSNNTAIFVAPNGQLNGKPCAGTSSSGEGS